MPPAGAQSRPIHSKTVLRPISENTPNAALRRLGSAQGEVTSHGFRTAAATLLSTCGLWHADPPGRELARVEGSAARGAWARGERWDKLRECEAHTPQWLWRNEKAFRLAVDC